MCQDVGGVSAWKVCFGAGVLAMHALSAHAQPANVTDGAPSEAARRQALSPFRMILQNADAPRRAAPAAAPTPKRVTATPEATAAAAPAPAPVAAVAPSAGAAQAAASPAPAEVPKAEQVSAALPSATAQKAPEPPPPIELVPLQQDAPVLNASLRREQLHGKVMVAFSVKPDGSTADVQVVQTSDRRLNSASVTAVSGWRFRPIRAAQPVEVELVFGDQ